MLLLYICSYSNESVYGFGYVKKRKESWGSWGRGTVIRIYYIKNDYSIKKKRLQEKETGKLSEQYGSMHIRTPNITEVKRKENEQMQ